MEHTCMFICDIVGLNIFYSLTEHDKGLGRAEKLCLALSVILLKGNIYIV